MSSSNFNEKDDKRKVSTLILVILVILHFCIASIMPIYNKELFSRYPFPLFDTLLQMTLSSIPALIIASIESSLNSKINSLIPPITVIPKLVLTSLLYGVAMLSGNLGYYVSDVDFTVLFKLSTIVTSGLCGIVFLHERINTSGWISIVLVIIGLLLLSSNFEWSQAKIPSVVHFVIQITAVLSSSFASLTLKITINAYRAETENYSEFLLLFWRYVIGSIPVFFTALYMESSVFINLDKFITAELMLWTLTGVVISGVYQLLITKLTGLVAMITLTVVSQLKFLPTILISTYLYNATEWTENRICGLVSLCLGSFSYCLSRSSFFSKKENPKPNKNVYSGLMTK